MAAPRSKKRTSGAAKSTAPEDTPAATPEEAPDAAPEADQAAPPPERTEDVTPSRTAAGRRPRTDQLRKRPVEDVQPRRRRSAQEVRHSGERADLRSETRRRG